MRGCASIRRESWQRLEYSIERAHVATMRSPEAQASLAQLNAPMLHVPYRSDATHDAVGQARAKISCRTDTSMPHTVCRDPQDPSNHSFHSSCARRSYVVHLFSFRSRRSFPHLDARMPPDLVFSVATHLALAPLGRTFSNIGNTGTWPPTQALAAHVPHSRSPQRQSPARTATGSTQPVRGWTWLRLHASFHPLVAVRSGQVFHSGHQASEL
jgi:hypothetical protein